MNFICHNIMRSASASYLGQHLLLSMTIAPDVVAELDVEHDANEQEVAVVPAHSFVYERVFNERMINFAFTYISANTLLVDQPWKKRGSAEKLRNALSICDDVLLKKEMADAVQRCIEWALHNPRPTE